MNLIKKLTAWYFSKNALPYWCVLMIDFMIIIFSGYVAFYLTMGGGEVASVFWKLGLTLLSANLLYIIPFRAFSTYSGIVRYSSFIDLAKVSVAVALGSAMLRVASYVVEAAGASLFVPLSWTTVAIMAIIATVLMWFERIVVKVMYDVVRRSEDAMPVLIYGVLSGGVSIAKSIRNSDPVIYKIKGFVDPDPGSNLRTLSGEKVYRDNDELLEIIKILRVQAILVSPLQSEHFRERERLINALLDEGVKIMMYPEVEEWDGKTDLRHQQLHQVDVEDLLPRNQIKVDMDAIGALLTGKKILITGAAGSIGSEMVRQIAVYKPASMILIDQAETPMHDVRLLMARKFPHIKCETIVTSIAKQDRMEAIFKEHTPDYVFHAAAYKHVPMMEDNPAEAVQNNIYGTRVIADLAVKYGTKKFVMISTDKAVNPTNVMGCSKRICEIYCQSLNKAIVEGKVKGVTQFVTTRFGNVLGSNGSVIPIFREQIANGGPITVTHPDIIRFFMLIPEACKLVLEAGTMGKGGEIFVFDMGKPVRIVDLAKKMIKLSGAKDIEIKFTGLRDGEKLYEEVLADTEETRPTVHPKIMVAAVREYEYEEAVANEERLLEASYSYDDMAIVKVMKEIVPEFKSKVSKYEALDN